MCLVLFYVDGRDGLSPRAVNGEACTPLVEDSCTPTDITLSYMTLLVMSSMSTSFTDSLTTLSSSDKCSWLNILGSKNNFSMQNDRWY
jgi:hypothetical protein